MSNATVEQSATTDNGVNESEDFSALEDMLAPNETPVLAFNNRATKDTESVKVPDAILRAVTAKLSQIDIWERTGQREGAYVPIFQNVPEITMLGGVQYSRSQLMPILVAAVAQSLTTNGNGWRLYSKERGAQNKNAFRIVSTGDKPELDLWSSNDQRGQNAVKYGSTLSTMRHGVFVQRQLRESARRRDKSA